VKIVEPQAGTSDAGKSIAADSGVDAAQVEAPVKIVEPQAGTSDAGKVPVRAFCLSPSSTWASGPFGCTALFVTITGGGGGRGGG